MDLAALKIFKAVVEQGGVTRAAAKLHRVPSNVTTRVKQLEEQLGAKLFLRNGRRLVLSSEGRLLLTYADQLLRISSEAETALRNGKPRGTLRIGALESTAAARLPPLLSRYHQAYPEVQLELVTGTSSALVARVHKQANHSDSGNQLPQQVEPLAWVQQQRIDDEDCWQMNFLPEKVSWTSSYELRATDTVFPIESLRSVARPPA